MIITVEISIYPLSEGYEKSVKEFLKKINSYPSVSIYTNRMSTYIKGEYDDVFRILNEELRETFSHSKDYSVVLKIIPQDLSMKEGYIDFS